MNTQLKELMEAQLAKGTLTPEEAKQYNDALAAHYAEENAKAMEAIVDARVKVEFEKMQEQFSSRSANLGNVQTAPKSNYSECAHMAYMTMKGIPIPDQLKALSEGTTTAGGWLVNELYRTELIQSMQLYGDALKAANVIPINTKTEYTPKISSGTTAYWVNEAAALTESQVVIAQPHTHIGKLGTLHVTSNELLADASFNVQAMLQYEDAIAMAKLVDAEYFTGSGGVYTGILPDTSLATYPAGSPTVVTFDKLVSGFNSVPQAYLAGASVYMHRTVWATLLGSVKSSTLEPLLWPSNNASQPSTLFGYPVVLSESMPAVDSLGADGCYMIVGNLKRSTRIWMRQDVSVEVSNAAYIGSTSMFSTDQSAIRTIMRLGIEVIRPEEILAFIVGA